MSVSLKCGEFLHKDFQVTRQISLELATIPWPTPRFENAPPDVKKEILQFLAKDALCLTTLGIQELDAGEAELARLAEADGTACGPCVNGGECPRVVSHVGSSTIKNEEIDVISVQGVTRPGFTGIRIDFSYKLGRTFKFLCNDAGCHQ